MGRVAQLLRLLMQPQYGERSVRLVADAEEEKACTHRRAPKPRDTMKRHSLQYVLPAVVRTEGLRDRPDHRLEMTTAAHIRALRPDEVTAWVAEQFAVGRMEINVAGDFDENDHGRASRRLHRCAA